MQREEEYLKNRRLWLFNPKDLIWTDPSTLGKGEAAHLSQMRIGLACGLYTLRNGTRVIVAAGGSTGRTSASDVRYIEWYNLEVRIPFFPPVYWSFLKRGTEFICLIRLLSTGR